MLSRVFEIKVALLGHVSVGKTTLINALLQEKFSEVSKKRTTAGINHFRILSSCKPDDKSNEASSDGSGPETEASPTDSDTILAIAKETLREITEDNKALRMKNEIQEKVFDVDIGEPLLQMRHDTHLVLVDIPGINEAHSSKIYLDYVTKSWDTFDCAIVIMDANSGVNTQEQIELLKLVKKNLQDKKEIPVIVVCNKVDDPGDEEMTALVAEVQNEVEKIFSATDRKSALSSIFHGKSCKRNQQLNSSPAFLSMSAENAFLYRTAARLDLNELDQLDNSYLEKIGHEEVGKYKWRKLSKKEKHKLVHRIVSDPEEYKERLSNSNFDTFLSVFQYFLGGVKVQEDIIEKQLQIALKNMSFQGGYAEDLSSIYDRCAALGKPTNHLKQSFWSLHKQCHRKAFTDFCDNPLRVVSMHTPLDELIKYSQGLMKKLHREGTADVKLNEELKVTHETKKLVRQYIMIIFEKESQWVPQVIPEPSSTDSMWSWRDSYYDNRYGGHRSGWYNETTREFHDGPRNKYPFGIDLPSHWTWDETTKRWKNTYSKEEKAGNKNENPAAPKISPLTSWEQLSPKDWSTIVSSVLMMSGHDCFIEHFGQEIADLEWLGRVGRFASPDFCYSCKTCTCKCSGPRVGREFENYMAGSYTFGSFEPADKAKYDRAVQIKVPSDLSDPSHWGHLAWMFCNFMEADGKDASNV